MTRNVSESDELGCRSDCSVLAISHAYVRSSNRSVFDKVAGPDWKVSIVAPTAIDSGQIRIECEPRDDGDSQLDSVELLQLPTNGNHLRGMTFVGLDALLKKVSPDAIFVEADPGSRVVLELSRYCKKNDIPILCLTNENLMWGPIASWRRTGLRGLPAAFAKTLIHLRMRSRIDHVFTTSSYARDIFRVAGYSSVSVLPLGFDRDRFRYSSSVRHHIRQREGIAANETVISYFGRITPEKGVDVLIDALGRLQHLPWRLFLNDFISNSDYSQRIGQQIQSLGFKDRVHTVRSRHGAIAQWMCASDVTVLPSRTTAKWVEQFGRVVTEAMATGNYLIVSDSGTPKELVGDCGQVVSEGNTAELATHLEEYLNDPKRFMTKRKKALRRARRKYSANVQASEIKDHLERLCEKRLRS